VRSASKKKEQKEDGEVGEEDGLNGKGEAVSRKESGGNARTEREGRRERKGEGEAGQGKKGRKKTRKPSEEQLRNEIRMS